MRRLVLLAALLVAPATAQDANAAGECRGLDVCVSAPGPWVAVPPASARRASVVNYQMTCPRRHVVGGLDAVLSDRRIDVKFLGALGSPVNPGITTGRSVVFMATYARERWTSFRPFIGCIPLSGGGGRQTTAYTPSAFTPAAVRQRPKPPERRVRTLRVRPGAARGLEARCASTERLVGSSHAIGFHRKAAPSVAMMAGVRVARSEGEGRASVSAERSSAVPRGTRVEVQLHLLCAGGPA